MNIVKITLGVLALLVAYLLFWPTGLEPVAWQPPPAPPSDKGEFAYNEKLKGIQRLLDGTGNGPEAVNVDALGRLYAGYADGRIITTSRDAKTFYEMANTGGRPLGITFGPRGGVVIADAKKGLLHLGRDLTVLSTEAEGVPFGFTDDVDNTRMDRNLYFTDASHKFGYGKHMLDLLEHGPNGRLLVYNWDTKETRVLLDGLQFANGVAVGPDDRYVLVNETGKHRVQRYWLKGPKKGTSDVFIQNLPGYPDNITFNGKDRFWVALFAPRDKLLDDLLPGGGFLRKVVARLPAFLQPKPRKHSWVIALNLNGKVIANLQYAAVDAYSPITSVREHGRWLYFGSLTDTAIGRLPLKVAIPTAKAPPPGWETPPEARQIDHPVSDKQITKKRWATGKGE